MLKIDPILLLLFLGMMIFTAVLVWVEYAFKDDGQIYQTIATLVAGFSGAFFMRINPKNDDAPKDKDNVENK
jgi:hypothetical protein